MIHKKYITPAITLFITYILFSFNSYAKEEDKILAFSVQETLGSEEKPTVRIKLDIQKTRELFVAVQDINNKMQRVDSTQKRIKKSGNYHFDMDIDLKPGKYRFNAYIAPRGKGWNERIGKQQSVNVTVIDAPKYIKKTKFSKTDKVKQITWPKSISDNTEQVLTIKYDITQPRILLLKLLNKKGWKEEAVLKLPLKQPGQQSLPINSMLSDFGVGDYAWAAIITDEETGEVITKQGKPFTIGNTVQ
jgi:hypothetical protein